MRSANLIPIISQRSRILSLVLLGLSVAGCRAEVSPDTVPLRSLLFSFGTASGILRLTALTGGLVMLMIGWRVYRVVVAVPGFLIGGYLGVQLGHSLFENGGLALVGMLVGGLLGAALTLALHDLAVFGIGAVGGAFIANNLWQFLGDGRAPALVLVVGAVLGGLTLIALAKLWMMLVSAAVGATMIAWGVQDGLSLMLSLFAIGLAVQFLLARVLREDAFAAPRKFG